MTIPLPTISMTQVVIDWITSLGWDTQTELGFPMFEGSYIVVSPDRALFITMTGGPGFVTEEGSADVSSFQARIRGTTDDASGPGLAIQTLDVMIFNAQYPVQVDGVTIQHVHRLAGPPTPMPVDPNDLRHEFTCSYLMSTGV